MEITYLSAESALSRRKFIRTGAALAAGSVFFLSRSATAGAVSINPGSSWAIDRPPKGPLAAEDVKFLLVHHSASQNGHTGADAPGIIRSFYDFHTGPEKGWNDIAYNFLIDSDGGIWEGRSGSLDGPVAGDATGGNQGFMRRSDWRCCNRRILSPLCWHGSLTGTGWISQLVCVIGDTSPGAKVSFVSRGSNVWPAGSTVTTPTVTGHRTMSQTTCPGDNLYSYVIGSLVGDVNVARGGVAPTPTSNTSVPVTAESSSPVSQEASSPTIDLTTTVADPIPTTASTLRAPTSIVTTSPKVTAASTASLADSSTPTTILPLAAEASAPATSPLIWGGLGLAGLVSGLLAWRLRRMGD